MVRNNEEIETLIGLFLKGEATPEQAMELEDWKAQSEENLRLFTQLEQVFALTHAVPVFEEKNENQAWEKVESQLQDATPKKRNWNWLYAAAAVILLAVIYKGIINFQGNPKTQQAQQNSKDTTINETVIVASNAVQSFKLKDQSVVELQPGSKLILDKQFNQKKRLLELKGSGKFTVIHNELNPFILKVRGMEVFDIGTVFNVKNSGDTVKVSVDEGEVEVRLNGKVISVTAGDSAFYVVSKQLISRYKRPSDRIDHTFVFDGTSLKEVASVLSAFFNRKIVIVDKEIEDCPLSVTFKNENLATILDIIKELMDVRVSYKNDTIGIYGTECN
jgi:ferric-dicitrate binding protein FerR (iron transport regulator)